VLLPCSMYRLLNYMCVFWYVIVWYEGMVFFWVVKELCLCWVARGPASVL
jgi:hypothetical protein